MSKALLSKERLILEMFSESTNFYGIDRWRTSSGVLIQRLYNNWIIVSRGEYGRAQLVHGEKLFQTNISAFVITRVYIQTVTPNIEDCLSFRYNSVWYTINTNGIINIHAIVDVNALSKNNTIPFTVAQIKW